MYTKNIDKIQILGSDEGQQNQNVDKENQLKIFN